ncbi:nif-specific transcriptional activator NifA [Azospirillum rugosum]|uniref:Nif-specific regulatory protein n=1 Tax=Azospirillum rugosum TaxID=416170 RepID=A0ABS4SNN7_9PROT|nr:nif-specific transcriptional activator NifA [Azospirillum rugosum]MBP2294170.1 Nif-specific regulatory protein [Azospirillum rugosum]MDQ0527441.1 Nif-specific regulatory protein [Azospirillum rugosum]
MPGATRQSTSNLELLTIYEVSKILGSSLDLQQTLREVLRALAYQLQMHRGRVYLVGEDNVLRLVAGNGLSNEAAAQAEFREGEGITGRILKTGMPAVVPNLAEEPLFLNRTGGREDLEEQVASLVGVPIKAAGTVIGVLTIDRISDEGPQGHFGSDVRFLTMVANLIGQTVRLHRTVAEERRFMMRETFRMQKELRPTVAPIDDVVCTSPNMLEVMAQLHRVAPFKSTVLIRGESGTGKELIARAIHNTSPRKDAPFIRVNCAALPESLLESELFGHEKGAFTGAQKDHKGRFELASGGTLFLDEIGDISPNFQAKLLRVLQEQEFERVGGSKTIKTDVRLICATNLNLEEAVGHGKFRADLYFRINVVTIHLPPLRERRQDIGPLARHFVAKFGKDNGMNLAIDDEALEVLNRCTWPGNVRELENCIERAATQCRDGVIRPDALSCSMNLCNSSILFQYRTLGASVGGLAPSMARAAVNPAHPAAAPAGTPSAAKAFAPQPGGVGSAAAPSAMPAPLPDPVAAGAAWPACASSCAAGPTPGCGAAQPAAPAPLIPLPLPEPSSAMAAAGAPSNAGSAAEVPLDEPESGSLRDRLLWAMERTGWVQAKAARLLGMTTRQVSYALRKYNIEIKRF